MGDTQANQRKKTRGEDYIAQGSILAVAVVITKIIGVVYRIPLTNILGMRETVFTDMLIKYMRLH